MTHREMTKRVVEAHMNRMNIQQSLKALRLHDGGLRGVHMERKTTAKHTQADDQERTTTTADLHIRGAEGIKYSPCGLRNIGSTLIHETMTESVICMTSPAPTANTHQNHATSPLPWKFDESDNFKTMTNKERQELVENLRDRVADIKWDVQKVRLSRQPVSRI